jgi:hypothetical protein
VTRTRIAVAATALALAAAGPAPATEPNDAVWTGRCGILAVSDPTYRYGTAGAFDGEVHAALLVTSGTPEHNPVSAVVTCTVYVNGILQTSATGTGSGYVAVQGRIGYPAQPDDTVDLCTSVTTTDQHGQTKSGTACQPVAESRLPSTTVSDLTHEVAHQFVNSATCGTLQRLYPYDFGGLLDVTQDGDVYLSGALVWDCPPYDERGTSAVYLHLVAGTP